MKFQLKNMLAVMAISLAFASCSKNDDDQAIVGAGNLTVEFDNVFGSANLILNSQSNVTSQGETLKISNVKYIVSNIVLTKEDGTTYTYPKNQGYFIVDETDEESQEIKLLNIPAGNYIGVKFGIGVDQEKYNLGESAQGDFLTKANDGGMMWPTWNEGYKFLSFEGDFTSSTVTSNTSFKVHTGKTGSAYNYTAVSLGLPEKALVRTTITPEIHIFADVAKIIDGTNKIKLSDNNSGGTGAEITSGSNLTLISQNVAGMFTVNHVHND